MGDLIGNPLKLKFLNRKGHECQQHIVTIINICFLAAGCVPM